MARQRRRSGGGSGSSRCNDCGAPIKWLKSPFSSKWRPFEPSPVGPNDDTVAYPVEALRAWKFDELVEELMVRRDCSRAEAQEEAHAFAWYALHHCPNTRPRGGTE